jgi:hypothetical protein
VNLRYSTTSIDIEDIQVEDDKADDLPF